MSPPGLRTRPTKDQRRSMLLKRATTMATQKHGTGSVLKGGGRQVKTITLAPTGRNLR